MKDTEAWIERTATSIKEGTAATLVFVFVEPTSQPAAHRILDALKDRLGVGKSLKPKRSVTVSAYICSEIVFDSCYTTTMKKKK